MPLALFYSQFMKKFSLYVLLLFLTYCIFVFKAMLHILFLFPQRFFFHISAFLHINFICLFLVSLRLRFCTTLNFFLSLTSSAIFFPSEASCSLQLPSSFHYSDCLHTTKPLDIDPSYFALSLFPDPTRVSFS